MPTFIDFKDNFHSNAVEEDNFLLQFRKFNKTSLFVGDDTWVSLYPDSFTAAYPYDSFNVKDLDTVDKGVIKHLLPAVE